MATREEAFRLYLRTGDPTELRAMGEQGSPGNIVAPEFSSEVIRLAKEYDSLFGDMEFYSTPNGAPMVRPSVQAFTLGASNRMRVRAVARLPDASVATETIVATID